MKASSISILLLFVFCMTQVALAELDYYVQEPQPGLENVVITPYPQKEIAVAITTRSDAAMEANGISIGRTDKPVLIKPTEEFVVIIENESVDVKQIEEPRVLVEIETPELSRKVGITREAQGLHISVDNVTAFTTNELKIIDSKLYVVSDEKALVVNVLPVAASATAKRIEPQLIEEMELVVVDDDTPVYEIRGVQSVEVVDGVVSVELVTTVDAETGLVKELRRQMKKNGQPVEEAGNELLIVEDSRLVKLGNVTDKELKREKLLVKSVTPLVAIEKIELPLSKKERFVLQVERGCVLPAQELVVRTENYDFVVVETDDVKALIENEGVLKVGDESRVKDFVNYSREVLEVEAEEKIRELDLKKNLDDVLETLELQVYMAEDGWDVKEGQVSQYQQFVTPDEVQDVVAGLTEEAIYEKAISFVWVSDSVLHNTIEKWMLPADFLAITPTMETNPVKGEIASDCSEQANTLVSMLRASGVPAEDVRVALGNVNFDGEVGGHAWAEIKVDGRWQVLEATSGPFYDEEGPKLVNRNGFSYDYWKYHEYPVVEVWAYYNDKYFTDEKEEVASGWSEEAGTALEEDILKSFVKQGFNISDIFSDFIAWLRSLFS